MTIDFGTDIRVDADSEDADGFFSEVYGVALVKQDLRHALMTDSVLGPGGRDRGFDLRRLIGSNSIGAAAYQPIIKKVCEKDQRIQSASVVIIESGTGALRKLLVTVACQTALGPFTLIFKLDPSKPIADQVAVIEAQ